MLTKPQPPRIHLPKGWQGCVKSAVLQSIALAHYAIVYVRAWATDSINARVRLVAGNDRLHEACALLREELRIKDTRMAQIAPQRRPHYGPYERMAIPELRAARGWSLKQTADTFLVTQATIASWLKRIYDQGAKALLHLRDLTAVPTSVGFWAPWLPFALPQCWPFCWWVAAVIDHHSRRVMGIETFRNNPTTVSVSRFLECAICTANATPKFIICDKGQQFWCSAFKDWRDRQGITPPLRRRWPARQYRAH